MKKAAISNYVQEVDSDLLTDRRSYNLEGVIFLGKNINISFQSVLRTIHFDLFLIYFSFPMMFLYSQK